MDDLGVDDLDEVCLDHRGVALNSPAVSPRRSCARSRARECARQCPSRAPCGARRAERSGRSRPAACARTCPSSATSSWLRPPAGSSSRSSRRLGDEGARELDALQRPERQARTRPLGQLLEADVAEHLEGAGPAASGRGTGRARMRPDEDVVENGHRAEQLDVLERARDASTRDPEHAAC